VEASHGTIGSLVDNLLTYCFRYDPTQNGHTLLYIRIIQAGGALTVLALAWFLVVNFRRDLREARANPLAGDLKHKTPLVNG
jgi:protein SCO1/2